MEEAPAQAAEAPSMETAPPEQTPAQESTPTSLLGGESQAQESEGSWLDNFSEEYRENPNIAKYSSLDEMAKGLINQASLIGKKGLVRPGEDATKEEWNNFYNSIGRPETADSYEYKAIEGAPDADPERLSAFKEFSHSKGFTQEQFNDLIEYQYNQEVAVKEQLEAQAEEEAKITKNDLMKEWGPKFDDNLRVANKIADKLGLTDLLIKVGADNNKEVISKLYDLSSQFGEATFTGDTSVMGGGFESQIKAIKSDPAWDNPGDPRHRDLVQKFNDLYAQRYG